MSLESKGSQVKIKMKIQFFDKSKYKVIFLDYSLILVSLSSDWTTTCQQPGALLRECLMPPPESQRGKLMILLETDVPDTAMGVFLRMCISIKISYQ